MVVLTGISMVRKGGANLVVMLESASRICDRIFIAVGENEIGDIEDIIKEFDRPPSFIIKYQRVSWNDFSRRLFVEKVKKQLPDTDWVFFLDEFEEITTEDGTPIEEIRSIIGSLPPEFNTVSIDRQHEGDMTGREIRFVRLHHDLEQGIHYPYLSISCGEGWENLISQKERGYWNWRYNRGQSGMTDVESRGGVIWETIDKYVDVKEKRVLDVGCGNQMLIEGKEFLEYTAMDISEVIIRKNREKVKCKFICADASSYEEEVDVDVVFCFSMLFHIMDDISYERILTNLSKWSGEYLFISTWHSNPFKGQTTDGKYQTYREFHTDRIPMTFVEKVVVNDYQSLYVFKRSEGRNMIRVYTHPRSGTHFLLNLLHRNFYRDTKSVIVEAASRESGHWSRRLMENTFMKDGKDAGSSFTIPYTEIFGSHSISPPTDVSNCIYLMRDGRDVALSCWNWKGSMSESMENLSLSDYLQTPIDWVGSFGRDQCNPYMKIFEHWKAHVSNYVNSGMFVVQYEELLSDTENVMRRIAEHFKIELIPPFDPVVEKVGWNPTDEQDISKWKKVMDTGDIVLYNSIVPEDFPGRW